SPCTLCGGMVLPAGSTRRITSSWRDLNSATEGLAPSRGPSGRTSQGAPGVAWVNAMVIGAVGKTGAAGQDAIGVAIQQEAERSGGSGSSRQRDVVLRSCCLRKGRKK